MSGEFHDRLGGNHASLYEIGRFCEAICVHAGITCNLRACRYHLQSACMPVSLEKKEKKKKEKSYADAIDAHIYLK
jgi:hypothetical protein